MIPKIPSFELPSALTATPQRRLVAYTGLFVWGLLLAGMLGVIISPKYALLRPITPLDRVAGIPAAPMARDTLTEADRRIEFSSPISLVQVVDRLPYMPRLTGIDDPDLEPATFAQRWDALNGEDWSQLPETPIPLKTTPRASLAKPEAFPERTGDAEIVQADQGEVPTHMREVPTHMRNAKKMRREMRPEMREARGGDVCSRHGLRRVETRGGRSWRCRR